jgi:hypothetical protein
MHRSFVYGFGYGFSLAAWLLACEGDAPVPQGEPRVMDASVLPEVDATPQLDARVAAASDSATARCDVTACQRQADELAQTLRTAAPDSLKIDGGDCARVDIDGVAVGMACTCLTSNGWAYIGPEGAGCFARGRAGDCLWDDSEFEACSEGDPACRTHCAELDKRYAADAAKTFDVEIRASACLNDTCHFVLRIEDQCYADHSFESGRRFDCALSDAEILERESSAQKAP